MSKARDDYYEFKKHADMHYEGLRDQIENYVRELEQEKAELFNALKKICETLKKHDCDPYNCEACYYDKLIKHTEAQNG